MQCDYCKENGDVKEVSITDNIKGLACEKCRQVYFNNKRESNDLLSDDIIIEFADEEGTRPRIICIDFNGVIAEHSDDEIKEDQPIEGASKGTHWLKNHGWTIIIFTCRENDEKLKSFLDKNDIYYDHINNQPGRNHPKPIADIYLDDKAIKFDGDWGFALEQIEDFCPWHQKKAIRLISQMKETRQMSCKTCEEPIVGKPIQYLGDWYHLDCLMPPDIKTAAEDSFNPANNNESELEDSDDTKHRNDTNQKGHKPRRPNWYKRDDINEVWPDKRTDEYPSQDKHVHKPSRIYN